MSYKKYDLMGKCFFKYYTEKSGGKNKAVYLTALLNRLNLHKRIYVRGLIQDYSFERKLSTIERYNYIEII
jgi:hypothetical protein